MYRLTSTARPGIVPVALPAWLASWSSVSGSAGVDGRKGRAAVLGCDASGCRVLPHLSTVPRPIMPEASPEDIQAVFLEPPLEMDFASAPVLGPAMMSACDAQGCRVVPLMGARAYRAQRRCLQRQYAALCLVQDFAKELPEDDMIDLGEIPGLVPPAKASFTFIQGEMGEHLAGGDAGSAR